MKLSETKGRLSASTFFHNKDLNNLEYNNLNKLVFRYRRKVEELLLEVSFLNRTINMQKAKIEILSRCKGNNNSFKHLKVFKHNKRKVKK